MSEPHEPPIRTLREPDEHLRRPAAGCRRALAAERRSMLKIEKRTMKKRTPHIAGSQTRDVAVKLQLEPGRAGLDDVNQNLPQSTHTAADPAKPSRAELEAEVETILAEAAGVRDGKLA